MNRKKLVMSAALAVSFSLLTASFASAKVAYCYNSKGKNDYRAKVYYMDKGNHYMYVTLALKQVWRNGKYYTTESIPKNTNIYARDKNDVCRSSIGYNYGN